MVQHFHSIISTHTHTRKQTKIHELNTSTDRKEKKGVIFIWISCKVFSYNSKRGVIQGPRWLDNKAIRVWVTTGNVIQQTNGATQSLCFTRAKWNLKLKIFTFCSKSRPCYFWMWHNVSPPDKEIGILCISLQKLISRDRPEPNLRSKHPNVRKAWIQIYIQLQNSLLRIISGN